MPGQFDRFLKDSKEPASGKSIVDQARREAQGKPSDTAERILKDAAERAQTPGSTEEADFVTGNDGQTRDNR